MSTWDGLEGKFPARGRRLERGTGWRAPLSWVGDLGPRVLPSSSVGHPLPNPRMRPSSSDGSTWFRTTRRAEGLSASSLPPSSPPRGARPGGKRVGCLLQPGALSCCPLHSRFLPPLPIPPSSTPSSPLPEHTQNRGDTPRGVGTGAGQPCFTPAAAAPQSFPAVSWLPGFPRRGRGATASSLTHSSAEPTLITLIHREDRALPSLPFPHRPAPTHGQGPQGFCPYQEPTDS